MDINALKNKEVFPDGKVLQMILGESFHAFNTLSNVLAQNEIVPEWRYYRDGNAWLCKLLAGKKNLGWLHVYQGYFTVTCHFMERHIPQIQDELQVSESIKKEFYEVQTAGKLMPMHIRIYSHELPEDVLTMLLFKKKMK